MQTDRLLSIILILMNRGLVTGQELADHFEVSLRTIYRDIDKISSTMVPVASLGGKGGGFYIMEGYKLDKLFFSRQEVKPLLSVMKSLKNMLGKNEAFNSCINKFENLYPAEKDGESLLIDMSDNSHGGKAGEYLDIINTAIEENLCLVFNYTNRRLETTERIVEPLQIYFFGGSWYFAAFCRSRCDYRKFKLIRVSSLRLGDKFEKRELQQEELEKLFDESFRKRSIEVTLNFSERMAVRLMEYFSDDEITKNPDGSCTVRFISPNEEGLRKFILGFGADCRILSPGFLINDFREYLDSIRDIYITI